MGNKPYHDKDTLERLYHGEGLTQPEIAERFGVSTPTISDWMGKFDIETNRSGGGWYGPRHDDERLYDPNFLEEWYVEKQKTSREIADELGCDKDAVLRQLEENDIEKRPGKKRVNDGRAYDEEFLKQKYLQEKLSSRKIANILDCSKDVVLRQLDKFGIEKRDTSEATKVAMDTGHAGFHTNQKGYELSTTRDPERANQVAIHRLVAVAHGADIENVFDGYKHHVHHKNGIPWDNRPENLEVVTASEHRLRHNE